MPNFLNVIIHLSFFETVHYHFRDIKMKSQQYRVWSACTLMFSLTTALYCWLTNLSSHLDIPAVPKMEDGLFHLRNSAGQNKKSK